MQQERQEQSRNNKEKAIWTKSIYHDIVNFLKSDFLYGMNTAWDSKYMGRGQAQALSGGLALFPVFKQRMADI